MLLDAYEQRMAERVARAAPELPPVKGASPVFTHSDAPLSSKQTSPEMAALAGGAIDITPREITDMGASEAAALVRRLAASVLTQFEGGKS